jgi:beta-glucanase (GH16 family)
VTFAISTSASTVPPPPPGWSIVFSDSFSGAAGSGVDSSWTDDIGSQYRGTSACPAQWGTGEVETDTASAANVSQDGGGHLNITPVNSNGTWTSGRLETVADNFAAPAGGMMEVSASIMQPGPANGLGYWPAFWMLGAGFRVSGAGTSGTMNCSAWPSTGEIDVMEDVNAGSQVAGTLHCGTDPGGPCNETTGLGSGLQQCPGCQTGFNTYSVIINRATPGNESITWFLNGNAYHTVTESQVGAVTWQAAIDHGFFLLLDVAIGGSFPGAICGCTTPTAQTSSGAAMSVGYVAVATRPGSGSAAPLSPSAAPLSPPPAPISPAETVTPAGGQASSPPGFPAAPPPPSPGRHHGGRRDTGGRGRWAATRWQGWPAASG